jgi:hypothetical protein
MVFIHADRGRNHQIFQTFDVEIFSRKGFPSLANCFIFGLRLLIESRDYNVNKISPLQRIDAFCSNTTGTPHWDHGSGEADARRSRMRARGEYVKALNGHEFSGTTMVIT